MVDIVLAVIVGLIVGGIVNALADDLPFRRNPGLPTYPDGSPRPITAWLGIIAFLLGQHEPKLPAPDDRRARPYYTETGEIVATPTRLSVRYPLTELLTIILMLMTVIAARDIPEMTALQLAFYMIYMAIFVLIVVIDMEHKLILRIVIFPSVILALLDALIAKEVGPGIRDSLIGAAFGFSIFFVAYLGGFMFNKIMGRIRGQRIDTVAFGYGDVMMNTFSGALLGFGSVFLALFITVFLGAAGAIIYLIARRVLAGGYSMFTAIPYGPYIVAGTIIMLLYTQQVQCQIWGYSLIGKC